MKQESSLILTSLVTISAITLAIPNIVQSQDIFEDAFDSTPSTKSTDSRFGEGDGELDDLFGDGPRTKPAAGATDALDEFDAGFDSGNPARPKPHLASRYGANQQNAKHQQKWVQLRQMVLDAKDEKTRKQHASELQSFLQSVFDEDLARREQELGKLEARLKKLRDSVEMRKTNRDRIINVRMDALLLDAQGLGLPGLGASPANRNQWTRPPQIESLKVLGRNRNGSVAVRVSYSAFRNEQRTRTVVQTAFEKRPGTNALIPVKKEAKEAYTVQVPFQKTSDFLVPAGEDMTKSIKQQIAKATAEGAAKASQASDIFGDDGGDSFGVEDDFGDGFGGLDSSN